MYVFRIVGLWIGVSRGESGGPPPEKFWQNGYRIVFLWTIFDKKLYLIEFFLEILALVLRECKRIYDRFHNQERHCGVEYLVAYLFHVLEQESLLLEGNIFERLNLLIVNYFDRRAKRNIC